MKRKILVFMMVLMIAVMPGYAVSAMDYSLDGGEFTSSDDNWGINERKDFTKLPDDNRKSVMENVFEITGSYVYGDMNYFKYGPACNSTVSSFSDLTEAKVFFKDYVKKICKVYMEEKGFILDDDYTLTPVEVIRGEEGDFLRIDIFYEDSENSFESIYITHVRSNIYQLFHEDRFTYDDTEDQSMKMEKCHEDFVEVVETYTDTGYLDKFLKKAEKRTVIEKIGGADVLLSNIKIYVLVALVIIVPLVIFLIIAMKVIKKGNVTFYTKGRGDKKKTTKTVDGRVTTTVHCTYEDSLRSLRDSGLLTQKEYREMLEKHNR